MLGGIIILIVRVGVTLSKKKKKISLLSTLVGLLIICGLFYIAYDKGIIKFESNKKVEEKETDNKQDDPIIEEPKEEEKSKYQIIDTTSDARPNAVMIDNVDGARPQSGLQSAYMVYEITVEGGLTRLLALFKDADLSMVGPVRSARHYFLDYVWENDAIFVHHGWSPQAQSDIETFEIQNLNGLANPSNMFWREKTKVSPHNSFTNTEKMEKAATAKKYRMTSTKYQVLSYSTTPIDLTNYASVKDASDVTIKYSNSAKISYKYDSENKVYLRSHNGNKHIDYLTGEQLKVKNIIILNDIKVTAVAGDAKGRVNLSNVGTGSGYYITEGKAIKITWSKASRDAKTIYRDENNQILEVNDGNTFVQLQPSGQTPVIS